MIMMFSVLCARGTEVVRENSVCLFVEVEVYVNDTSERGIGD